MTTNTDKMLRIQHKLDQLLDGCPVGTRDGIQSSLDMITQELGVYHSELTAQNDELRRAHMEADAARRNYRNLFDHAPVGYLILNDSAMIIQTNNTFAEMVGSRIGDVVNRPFQRFLDEADVSRFLMQYRSFFKRPENKLFEFRMKGKTSRDLIDVTIKGRRDQIELPWAGRDFGGGVKYLLLTITDITRLKRAERKIQASEKKYRNIFESAPVGIFKSTPEGKLIEANGALARMLGYDSPEELIAFANEVGLGEAIYVDPEDRLTLIEQHRDNVGWLKYERRYRRKDGGTVTVHLKLRTVTEENGEKRLEGFMEDVTQRLAAERQQRFQAMILDQINDNVVVTDLDGKIVYVNQAVCDDLDKTRDEMVGRYIQSVEYIHRNGPVQRDIIDATLKTGQWRGEIVNRGSDGGEIVYDCRTQVIHDDAGERIALCGISTNITERKATEKALRESEERYRSVVTAMNEGVILQSSDGEVVTCNRAAARILGLNVDDLSGWTWVDGRWRYVREDGSPFSTREHPVVMALKTGKSLQNVIMGVKKPDGERAWISVNAEPIRLGGEEAPDAVVTTFSDITAQKKVEANLKRSNAELEQFAYIASHDLQEPLRAIAGFLQLLRKRHGDRLDDSATMYIDRSVAAATRMQQLINDLLSLSRVGTAAYEYEALDTNRILDAVVEDLQSVIEAERAWVFRGTLPEIYGDGAQIARLFHNLIVNALKYRGAEPPIIKIEGWETENGWRFSVSDNGIGIDPKFSDRIFQIFQRLHTRGAYPGTGIGLAICKKIVERHKGRIWVSSEAGEGATFLFTLSKKGAKHGP